MTIDTERSTTATHWVIISGRDCDGAYGSKIYEFSNKSEAEIFCDDFNEGSDGLAGMVTSNINYMIEFCKETDRNWLNYITVSYFVK